MTTSQQLSLEGVRLLKDWSSWMVTVDIAIIAFLGSALHAKDGLPIWAQVVAACLGGSILAAAWVLAAIPWIVLNLDNSDFENFYMAPLSSAPVLRRIQVWQMGLVQHLLFFGGIGLLLLGLAGRL